MNVSTGGAALQAQSSLVLFPENICPGAKLFPVAPRGSERPRRDRLDLTSSGRHAMKTIYYVLDESGNVYNVTISDVMPSNGVIHVVDGVRLPR